MRGKFSGEFFLCVKKVWIFQFFVFMILILALRHVLIF